MQRIAKNGQRSRRRFVGRYPLLAVRSWLSLTVTSAELIFQGGTRTLSRARPCYAAETFETGLIWYAKAGADAYGISELHVRPS